MKSSGILKMLLQASALLIIATTAYAETYTVDSRHTFPVFEVEHFNFTIQRGRFNKTTGVINYDQTNPEQRKVSANIVIDTTSVDMGLEDWNKHMRGEHFLNTDKFPTIRFVIPEFQLPVEAKVYFIPGELTLLGVTKPVTLAVMISCGKHPMLPREVCGANIETTIKRSDFGMNYGLPGIGDEVNIIAPVEAIKVVQDTKGKA
ncbi:MAG: YceI family protein [Rugosibacter sp.]|jgi:polyisoprenoid-binding protein YceI|nr:YceI family protein [Rugosibacter sp.]